MGTEVVLQAMRESGYTPTAIGIASVYDYVVVERKYTRNQADSLCTFHLTVSFTSYASRQL
jgi:hypothetical protein